MEHDWDPNPHALTEDELYGNHDNATKRIVSRCDQCGAVRISVPLDLEFGENGPWPWQTEPNPECLGKSQPSR